LKELRYNNQADKLDMDLRLVAFSNMTVRIFNKETHPLNTGKLILAVFFTFSMAVPLYAEGEKAKPPAPAKAPQKKEKPKKEGMVIGKNLAVGMPLEKAYKMLGLPKVMVVKRGLAPETDSVFISYKEAGIRIHSLTGKGIIEEIEALPTYKGSFDKGLKLGDSINKLISLYGVPQEFNDKIARYPKKGIFFFLKGELLVSAKWFVKGTKIFDRELIGQ